VNRTPPLLKKGSVSNARGPTKGRGGGKQDEELEGTGEKKRHLRDYVTELQNRIKRKNAKGLEAYT